MFIVTTDDLSKNIIQVSPNPIYKGGSDEYYLSIALKLAQRAEASTFPNPIVGSVIVYEGEHNFDTANENSQEEKAKPSKLIVGIGFHRKFGDVHAEVNAIKNAEVFFTNYKDKLDVKNQEDFFKRCTIYVSLEPCTHHGKTPPCANLISEKKLERLVYALNDPNPLLEKYSYSNIKITEPGSLDPNIVNEAKYQNRKFLKWIKTKKPWVILKIASTNDGRMTTGEKEPRWISNLNSRKLVHRMRSTNQLLITGIQTVLKDNPRLDVRYDPDELNLEEIVQPQRAILKSEKDFTNDQRNNLAIFDISIQEKNIKPPLEFKITKSHESPSSLESNSENPSSQSSTNEFTNLEDFIEEMSSKGFGTIMIEAGPILAKAFFEDNLIDEIVHFEPLSKKNEFISEKVFDTTVNKIIERYLDGSLLGNKSDENSIKRILEIRSSLIKASEDDAFNDICLNIILNNGS